MNIKLPNGYTLQEDLGSMGEGNSEIRLVIGKTVDPITGGDWFDLIVCNVLGSYEFFFFDREDALESCRLVSPHHDLDEGEKRLSKALKDIQKVDAALAMYIADCLDWVHDEQNKKKEGEQCEK